MAFNKKGRIFLPNFEYLQTRNLKLVIISE